MSSSASQEKFTWLTPLRCRLIFAAMTLVMFVGNIVYLHHAPIDLAGDEAHYWDWSRQLDWSYYSKGPAVAYLIRASCAIFGDTMPAVRYPAVLLAALTAIVTYAVTLKLFRSDKLALGATLLFQAVPLFVAGTLLMTIDPPFFFCWAVATWLLSVAVFDGRRWAWPAIGVAIGLGFLAKYAALSWLIGMVIYLAADRIARPLLKTAGPWIAVAIALACTTPVLIWNAQHNWVSFWHVAHQTGLVQSRDSVSAETDAASEVRPSTRAARKPPISVTKSVLDFVGSQLGLLGPGVCIVVIGGAAYALRRTGRADPNHRQLLLLVTIGGLFFVGTALLTLRSKVQANWPAPAYFTLVILGAYFLGTRMTQPSWKWWRHCFNVIVITALIVQPLARNFAMLYPLLNKVNAYRDKPLKMSAIDPSVRLRGWAQLGEFLTVELAKMPASTFVLCEDYQQTAEAAFYVAGQPRTYCAGSYFRDPKRLTQYDVWPDRRLDAGGTLIGRDALYFGKGTQPMADIVVAFERLEPLPPLDIIVGGVKIRSFPVWRCYSFRGMTRPTAVTRN